MWVNREIKKRVEDGIRGEVHKLTQIVNRTLDRSREGYIITSLILIKN